MEVSKLTLSDGLRSQTSTQHQILKWLQDHPTRCWSTNGAKLARAMQDIEVGYYRRHQVIQQMVQQGMLRRVGNKKVANFNINYYHADIPPDVLEKAPQEVRTRLGNITANLKDNQHIDKEGCLVTKTETPQTKTKDEEPSQIPTEEQKPIEANVNLDKNLNQLTITININLGSHNGN